MTVSEQKNYDLQYELGPKNQYDEIAGRAQLLSRKYKDPYLLDLSVQLADLIIKIPYNSDQFYKVISKASEIKKYLEILEKYKITHAVYVLKYEDIEVNSTDASALDISLKEHDGNYEIDFSQMRNRHSYDVICSLTEFMRKYCDINDPSFLKEEKVSPDFAATNFYTYLKNSEGRLVYCGIVRNHENEMEHGYFNTYFFPTSIGEEKIKQIYLELVTKAKSLVKKGFVLENQTQKRVQDTQKRISKEIAIEAGNFNLPQNDMERIRGYQDTPEDQEVLEMLVNKYFTTYIHDSFRVKSCTAYDLYVAKNHLISNNFVSPKIIEIIDKFIQWKSLSDKNESLLKNTPDKEIIDNITNFFKKIGLEEDWLVTDTFKTKFPEVISKKIDQIRALENVEVINVSKEPSKVYLVKVNTSRSTYWFYVTDYYVLNEDREPFQNYILNNI